MTQKVSGKVFKVYDKTFPPKGGKPGTTWFSIKLDGDDIYYRTKADRYAGIAEAGNFIAFEITGLDEASKSAEVVKGSVKKLEPEKSQHGTPLVPATSRETSIHYQSARKDALQYVDLMVRSQAIKLPAKEAAKLEALDAIVDRMTVQFFEDIASFGAVSRVNGTDGGKDESKPDAEDDE